MARVAVYDPYPRLVGLTTAGLHTLTGLRALGYEADFVTITRSGRPSIRWGVGEGVDVDAMCRRYGVLWHWRSPDRVFKMGDGALEQYDWVYLTEPRCPQMPDGQWRAELECATWCSAIYDPWDFSFRGESGREALDVISRGRCRGLLYSSPRNHGLELPAPLRFAPHMPYVPHDGPRRSGRASRTALLAGRVSSHKNLQLLAAVAEALPEGWRVAVRGSASLSANCCPTYELAERLAGDGWEVLITAPEGVERPVLKPFSWVARRGRAEVSYGGGYVDGYDMSQDYALSLYMSNRLHQEGILEYAQGLIPLDAHLPLVAPRHALQAAPYDARACDDDLVDLPSAAAELAAAVDRGDLPDPRRNEGLLRELHDPRRHVRTLEDML